MQHHNNGPSPRSSPTQSRPRRNVLRSTDASDVAQDSRAIATAAHTRTPVLIREPSLLESLSRNLRTFFPATISPPTPRRRPLSTGGPIEPAPAPEGERILWAAWDELARARVLLLGYPSGLQVWDASDLGTVRELLNLRADALHCAGPVLAAAVVPGGRAALAVLTSVHLTVYALETHTVVQQVPFNNPCGLVARSDFIVVATTHPAALHILASSTLAPLYTVSPPISSPPVFAASNRLLAYATPASAPGPPAPTFLAASPPRVALRDVWSAVAGDDRVWSASVGFSRSAPAAPGMRARWPESPPRDDAMPVPAAAWLSVLDLAPLLAQTTTSPPQVAHFAPFPPDHADVAYLEFASTKGGAPLLCAAPRGGQSVAVFELRGKDAMPWHRYALRRGVTSARVDGIVWAPGARWAGVVTARRTVHVFATNAEGGLPDGRAHLEGWPYNAPKPHPLSTELTPLVRLRAAPPPDTDLNLDLDAEPVPASAPLAVLFLPRATSRALPPSLRPAPPTQSAPVQDVLLFDAATGALALRRLALDWAAAAPSDLGAREAVVATWSLKRERAWPEVQGALAPLPAGVVPARARGKPSPGDFLAHAELSTHAPHPRSIYLAHQFSFHALGEDYHALLQRAALDVPCTPITVRRAIEVRGDGDGAEGAGEFVQHSRRRASFDEPLASAMRAALDYSGQSPPILPMLPNGGAGASRSVLIRTKHVAAGVNEGLGRIRRAVRSPVLRARRGVPLEFDEADEALFLDADSPAGSASVSVSTPSAGDDDGAPWAGADAWDDETQAAVAEAEMFDEISATGFMDEEQAPIMAAMQQSKKAQGKGMSKRR